MLQLSIVTINYNNLVGLRKTFESLSPWLSLASVKGQIEWIIVDGGSSDGSVDFIKQNERYISTWISESDTGVYNAMNKGATKVKGKYVLFLNSGDRLAKELMPEVLLQILNDSVCDLVYGDVLEEHINGQIFEKKQPEQISLDYFIGESLHHQSVFFAKRLFCNDCYDESYRIAADHDFLIRKLYKENCTIKHFPIPVCIYETFGMSAQQYYSVTRPELRKAISQVLPGGEYWYDSILLRKEMDNEQLFSMYQYLASARKLQSFVARMLKGIVCFHKWCKNLERKLRQHK